MNYNEVKAIATKTRKGEAVLIVFKDQMMQLTSYNKIDLPNEKGIMKILSNYMEENADTYEEFKIFQFSEYASATAGVTIEIEEEVENEMDKIEENLKREIEKANRLMKNVIQNKSKGLKEYEGRKFIFKKELMLKDENLTNSPMKDRLINNAVIDEINGKEVDNIKEFDFMGKKQKLGFVGDIPVDFSWLEEIK